MLFRSVSQSRYPSLPTTAPTTTAPTTTAPTTTAPTTTAPTTTAPTPISETLVSQPKQEMILDQPVSDSHFDHIVANTAESLASPLQVPTASALGRSQSMGLQPSQTNPNAIQNRLIFTSTAASLGVGDGSNMPNSAGSSTQKPRAQSSTAKKTTKKTKNKKTKKITKSTKKVTSKAAKKAPSKPTTK